MVRRAEQRRPGRDHLPAVGADHARAPAGRARGERSRPRTRQRRTGREASPSRRGASTPASQERGGDHDRRAVALHAARRAAARSPTRSRLRSTDLAGYSRPSMPWTTQSRRTPGTAGQRHPEEHRVDVDEVGRRAALASKTAERPASPIAARLGATAPSGAGIERIAASAIRPMTNVARSTANASRSSGATHADQRVEPRESPRAGVSIPPHDERRSAAPAARRARRSVEDHGVQRRANWRAAWSAARQASRADEQRPERLRGQHVDQASSATQSPKRSRHSTIRSGPRRRPAPRPRAPSAGSRRTRTAPSTPTRNVESASAGRPRRAYGHARHERAEARADLGGEQQAQLRVAAQRPDVHGERAEMARTDPS